MWLRKVASTSQTNIYHKNAPRAGKVPAGLNKNPTFSDFPLDDFTASATIRMKAFFQLVGRPS
jgi:hypothetical protein